jgi:quercetin dioxygenase-like cupin family protein
MKILDKDGMIDKRNTMYPSYAERTTNAFKTSEAYSSTYGYVLNGEVELPNKWIAREKEYFSFASHEPADFQVTGTAVFFTRLGHMHQNNLGGPIEDSGRLCYIDGCSDSLLIYPSRAGDPSVNLLAFPAGINQTFHIHPSVRLGFVAEGSGNAEMITGEVYPLEAGSIFCIEERENHRFQTIDDTMKIIAYHPDGDWGPTDQNHTMLNRTYMLDGGQ